MRRINFRILTFYHVGRCDRYVLMYCQKISKVQNLEIDNKLSFYILSNKFFCQKFKAIWMISATAAVLWPQKIGTNMYSGFVSLDTGIYWLYSPLERCR